MSHGGRQLHLKSRYIFLERKVSMPPRKNKKKQMRKAPAKPRFTPEPEEMNVEKHPQQGEAPKALPESPRHKRNYLQDKAIKEEETPLLKDCDLAASASSTSVATTVTATVTTTVATRSTSSSSRSSTLAIHLLAVTKNTLCTG